MFLSIFCTSWFSFWKNVFKISYSFIRIQRKWLRYQRRVVFLDNYSWSCLELCGCCQSNLSIYIRLELSFHSEQVELILFFILRPITPCKIVFQAIRFIDDSHSYKLIALEITLWRNCNYQVTIIGWNIYNFVFLRICWDKIQVLNFLLNRILKPDNLRNQSNRSVFNLNNQRNVQLLYLSFH